MHILDVADIIFLMLGIAAVLYIFLLWPQHGHQKWALLRRFRYAHRGFHGPGAPENSLAAFRLAAERGFGAELDVHLTRDGRLAVIHDSVLRRTCGAAGRVEDFTTEELRQFRLEGTEERIPLLEEVLPLFEGKTPLVVEIKPVDGNWNELTGKTAACLNRFSVDYCMESFDPRVLIWLRRNRPEIVRGQLSQNFMRRHEGLSGPVRFVLTNLLCNVATRPDFIAYRFEDRGNFSVWLCCHPLGAQEINWTIRSREDMEQAEREGHLVIFENFDPEGESE